VLRHPHQNGRTALRRRRVDPTEKLRDKKRDQRYAQDRRWEPAQPGRTRFGQFTEDTDEAVNGRAFIDKIHAARAAKVEAVCAAQQLALLGACRWLNGEVEPPTKDMDTDSDSDSGSGGGGNGGGGGGPPPPPRTA